jgi:hypothetical protein
MTGPRLVLLVAAVSSLVAALAAQQRPNFSGRWVQESPTDGAGQEQIVKHDATTLSTEHGSEGGGHRAVYKLDGTTSRNAIGSHGSEIVTESQASWKDDRLTITSTTTYPDGRRRLATEVWTLDAAGKLVIEVKEAIDGKSTADVKVVFVKRSSVAPEQGTGRAFVIVVDDARYVPDELESAGRLLSLLRDEVLTARDLVSIVSTGRSSVETDLVHFGNPVSGNRVRLNQSIRRIVEGPPSVAVGPRGAVADAAQLRHHAHVALLTARDVVANLALLDDRPKHVLLLSSGATSTAVLAAALASESASPEPPPSQRGTVDAAALLRDVAELAAAARRAGVRIHTVDVRDPASLEALRQLK